MSPGRLRTTRFPECVPRATLRCPGDVDIVALSSGCRNDPSILSESSIMTTFDRRTVLMAASILGLAAASGQAYAAQQQAGRVTLAVGRVDALLAAATRVLAAGDSVFVEEIVRTGAESRAGLHLGAATTVSLGPSTRLRIEQHLVDAGGSFELVDGAVLYDHPRPTGAAPSRAVMRSPYGLIAIRGTRFFAGPSRGVFGVFVAEGHVDVSGGGRTVAVPPGFGTDVAAPGQAPGTPRAWPQDRVRECLRLVQG